MRKEIKIHKHHRPPRYGDVVTKTKFALLPVVVEGHWIWLERYILIKTWTENAYYTWGSMASHGHDGWVKIRKLI